MTGAPISQNIYGQFLKHGADIVNEGEWAEVLADRKFYYCVSSTPIYTSIPARSVRHA